MPNPTTLIDGEERLNSEVTRDFVCDACYGELHDMYSTYEPKPGTLKSHWVVRCAAHPFSHHGFIKRTTAHIMQRKEEFRGRE